MRKKMEWVCAKEQFPFLACHREDDEEMMAMESDKGHQMAGTRRGFELVGKKSLHRILPAPQI